MTAKVSWTAVITSWENLPLTAVICDRPGSGEPPGALLLHRAPVPVPAPRIYIYASHGLVKAGGATKVGELAGEAERETAVGCFSHSTAEQASGALAASLFNPYSAAYSADRHRRPLA